MIQDKTTLMKSPQLGDNTMAQNILNVLLYNRIHSCFNSAEFTKCIFC